MVMYFLLKAFLEYYRKNPNTSDIRKIAVIIL